MPHGCWYNVLPRLPSFWRVLFTELPWSCFLRFRLHSIQPVACAITASVYSELCCFCCSYFNLLLLYFKNRIREVLHRGDRAMIYIFIASSYFPWLSLVPNLNVAAEATSKSSSSILPTLLSWCGVSSLVAADLRWSVWFLAAMGILYQQIFHEKYKWLETLIYVLIGLLPSLPFVHGVSNLLHWNWEDAISGNGWLCFLLYFLGWISRSMGTKARRSLLYYRPHILQSRRSNSVGPCHLAYSRSTWRFDPLLRSVLLSYWLIPIVAKLFDCTGNKQLRIGVWMYMGVY